MVTGQPRSRKSAFGRAAPGLALGWVAGCTAEAVPAPEGAEAEPTTISPSEPKAAGSPVVYKGKPDIEAFAASLRTLGIKPVTTKGIDLRTFRFSGMVDLLELTVTLARYPRPAGMKGAEELTLTSEEVVKEGTVNLAILPPATTGKDGAIIVVQILADGRGVVSSMARDTSPLWYATPGARPRIQSGLDFGSKLPIRRKARGLKLIGYSAADQLEFRCRAVEPRQEAGKPGADEPGPSPAPRD